MNILENILSSSTKYVLLILLVGIHSCKHVTEQNEFIGTYKIDTVVPLDSNSILRAQQASDWTISLKDSNNFHIYGTNINIIGYWNVQNNGPKEYSILLQGGGVTTTARFNGNEIYFDKPDNLLDSLFSEALFVKKKKN
ncbi:hypothetical protein [Terrimonas pollutisoli]|uniref:hypothetical protein n=1 Tax=Terrimonas pollutisoli TaxID=3034147 RepID=UPI0023EAAFF0|nr:hypothetical protein [Terrimonas sp. H1YJ31]